MEITNDMILAQAKEYVAGSIIRPDLIKKEFIVNFERAFIAGAQWMHGAMRIESAHEAVDKRDKELENMLENIPDWEQRRYEIAKQMMATIYLDEGQEARSGRHGLDFEFQSYDGCAKEAVAFADALITELVNNPKE